MYTYMYIYVYTYVSYIRICIRIYDVCIILYILYVYIHVYICTCIYIIYIQVTYNVAAASKNNMCTFVSKLDPELSGLQEGIKTARQQADKLSIRVLALFTFAKVQMLTQKALALADV